MTTDPTTNQQLWSYLSKVQGLLAKAEATTFPEEAAAYRAKAEELMRKYRIAEEDLIATGDPVAARPIRIDMDLCRNYSPFSDEYSQIAWGISQHVGARMGWKSWGREGKAILTLVGYESDLRVAQYLLASALLVFGERLEPEIKPELSDDENIYRLRQAGITRWDVAVRMWGREEGAKASAHAKVGRIYKQQCALRGESAALSGKGLDLESYRTQYAKQFNTTLYRRLRDARDAADAEGGVLVLHGRKQRVDEAFYAEFPHLRPKPKTEVAVQDEDAPKPKKVKGPTERQMEAAWAKANSPAARAGRAAGRAAAEEVEIARTTPRTKRLDDNIPATHIEIGA